MAPADELRSKEQEPTRLPEAETLRRETEQHVPVRTEQERVRELEIEQLERKILEAEHLAQPEVESAEAPSSAPVLPVQRTVDPVTREVEKILSEDLTSIFGQMTPQQQLIFKREGERAAGVIKTMLEQAKLKTKNLLDVIKRWLRLIPGVNKFFLEQEAKIKTDKIVALHDQLHGPRHD